MRESLSQWAAGRLSFERWCTVPAFHVFHRRLLTLVAVGFALLWFASREAAAQVGAGAVGGVYFDASGMLRETSRLEKGPLLDLLRTEASTPAKDSSVRSSSPLRKVSLRRLEREVSAKIAAGEAVTSEMGHLAGLQQVRYVFFYPDQNDVVLAGPAEGWRQLESSDVVGQRTGRPALHLDNLIVALRYAFSDEQPDGFLGCSIEPTEEGVKRHNRLVAGISEMTAATAEPILRQMEQAIGPQQILVFGAPASSRFALEMVAADYRLKRLALAHDPSPSKNLPSYLDFAEKYLTAGQPQHRWWFVGHYDAIRHTPDKQAFEFEGQGLRVDTAPTLVARAPSGKTPKPAKAATLFAEAATRALPELTEKIPAFAALQNLVSLAVAAELIRQHADGWRPEFFNNERACPLASYPAPKQTAALANVRFVRNQQWMFSISGGVEIVPASLAAPEKLQPARDARLGAAYGDSGPGKLPAAAGTWWWD